MSQQPSEPPAEPPSDSPPTVPQYAQQPYPSAPPLEGGHGYGGAVAYPGGYGDPGAFGPPRNGKLAITSLVLGILSIPLAFFFIGALVGLVGLILGIVGIAGAGRKNLKRGLGIAGIVLSAIGLIGGGLVITAEAHAANACKTVNRNDTTEYTNCFKHNIRL